MTMSEMGNHADHQQPEQEQQSRNRKLRFNLQNNQVKEYPRIPLEDKSKVWLSKIDIAVNRQLAKEETMMEQTKQLVQAKLVREYVVDANEEEVPTSTNSDATLLHQALVLQRRLDQIMSGSKEDILAFLSDGTMTTAGPIASTRSATTPHLIPDEEDDALQLVMNNNTPNNWIQDCSLYWEEIPANIQQAAILLGYSQQSWNDALHIAAFDKYWVELSALEQEAAKVLGYTRVQWDGDTNRDKMDTNSKGTNTNSSPSKPIALMVGTPTLSRIASDQFVPDYQWGEGDSSNSSNEPMPYDNDDDSSDDESESSMPDDDGDDDDPPTAAQGNSDAAYSSPAALFHQRTEGHEPDLEEFMSNFLSAEPDPVDPMKTYLASSAAPPSPVAKRRSSRIQQMYIPSDDELELDVEDEEDEEYKAYEAKQDDSEGISPQAPSTPGGWKQEEATPLLPGSPCAQNGESSKLFRRSATENRGGSSIGLEDEEKKKAVGRASQPGNPHDWTRTVLLAGVGLTMLVLGHKAVGNR